MSLFGWVADRREPPPQWDLRRVGWRLAPGPPDPGVVCLVDVRKQPSGADIGTLSGPADPARCLFLGADCGLERARLLEGGGGDALSGRIRLPELELRARRVAATLECVPRRRQVGPLTLDLLYRDARAGPGWLALHPREFELLWRLAERPGERVSRTRLLRDVWRVEFEPGTNSVEVHVSRLRAKLARAGLQGLVKTDPHGGYRVESPAGGETRFGEDIDQRLCA